MASCPRPSTKAVATFISIVRLSNHACPVVLHVVVTIRKSVGAGLLAFLPVMPIFCVVCSCMMPVCEWGKENPWEWGDKVAQSWRMAGDHTGIWSSTKQQIENTRAIPASGSGRPFGWNDMVRRDPSCLPTLPHLLKQTMSMSAAASCSSASSSFFSSVCVLRHSLARSGYA